MNYPACWGWKTPWPLGTIPVEYNGILAIEFINYHAGRCAMCNDGLAKMSTVPYLAPRKLYGAIDDRHDNNTVRGLLCWPCNTLEGIHRGLFYASYNGDHQQGHIDCDKCKLFDMYRLVNPAEILGFKIHIGEFSHYIDRRNFMLWHASRGV